MRVLRSRKRRLAVAQRSLKKKDSSSCRHCFPDFSRAELERLRPAGSDPEVVCQKNSFLKVSVSLGGFSPSLVHGKHSVRRRVVQATKNKAETCSLLDAIGRRSPFAVRFDSIETGQVCTVRYALSLKRPLSLPARTSLGTLTLSPFCMHRSGCSYCDASREFCLP